MRDRRRCGNVRCTVIARGLVNYTSGELPHLMGRSTKDLAKEIGPQYEREVIHRDHLVLTTDRT